MNHPAAASSSQPTDGALVLVTGATGAAGAATCAQLVGAGHRVVAVGRTESALSDLAQAVPGVRTRTCDLTDATAVADLVTAVHDDLGAIDGLAHLVGGWRGGKKFTDATEDDWEFLSSQLIDTLRHLTLAVHDDLVASDRGRAVIVSATAARRPTAGNAAYAAAKAAAEAWQLALADSLRRNQSGRKDAPLPQTSAAAILVITAIGDAPKFTPAEVIGARITALFDADAAELNGSRIDLSRSL